MTTIATDGRTIAADGLRCAGSSIISKTEKKIRVREGRVFAFTGLYAAFETAIAWYLAGHEAGKQPLCGPDDSWTLIVIDWDRVLRKYSSNVPLCEDLPYPQTFGIDCDFALAAMLSGKTPAEAIALAAEHNVYTGGEIMVVDIAEALGIDAQPLRVAAE
jgi:ATP-dependent protease HslVU (ClpYQ) peptidase subunit